MKKSKMIEFNKVKDDRNNEKELRKKWTKMINILKILLN